MQLIVRLAYVVIIICVLFGAIWVFYIVYLMYFVHIYIINTFIQIVFGTIGMYFRSFLCLIKIYISYNNNTNNSSTIAKLSVKVSLVLSSCLICTSIVCSSSATCAPYSCQTESIYTYSKKFSWQYCNYNTRIQFCPLKAVLFCFCFFFCACLVIYNCSHSWCLICFLFIYIFVFCLWYSHS